MHALTTLTTLFLVAASCDAVLFTEFSSNRRATGVKADTGYSLHALEYVWEKHKPALLDAARTFKGFEMYARSSQKRLETRVAVCTYCCLFYIHEYPTQATLCGHRFGDHTVTKTAFHTQVTPILYILATILKEIFYDDRLHEDNHGTGIMSKRVTTIIDCAPIFVQEPSDKDLANALYQKKYGGCCYKIQVCVGLLLTQTTCLTKPPLRSASTSLAGLSCTLVFTLVQSLMTKFGTALPKRIRWNGGNGTSQILLMRPASASSPAMSSQHSVPFSPMRSTSTPTSTSTGNMSRYEGRALLAANVPSASQFTPRAITAHRSLTP